MYREAITVSYEGTAGILGLLVDLKTLSFIWQKIPQSPDCNIGDAKAHNSLDKPYKHNLIITNIKSYVPNDFTAFFHKYLFYILKK